MASFKICYFCKNPYLQMPSCEDPGFILGNLKDVIGGQVPSSNQEAAPWAWGFLFSHWPKDSYAQAAVWEEMTQTQGDSKAAHDSLHLLTLGQLLYLSPALKHTVTHETTSSGQVENLGHVCHRAHAEPSDTCKPSYPSITPSNWAFRFNCRIGTLW